MKENFLERRLLEQIIERLDMLTDLVEEFSEKENLKWEYLTKEHAVFEYRRKNPYKGKAECVKDTGLSKETVNRYWDGLLQGENSVKKVNGRPSKEHLVIAYQKKYRHKTKKDCIKDTGLDKSTVNKYWDMALDKSAGEGVDESLEKIVRII